jgi:hypothetical protein
LVQDFGVLEFYEVLLIGYMFCHHLFVWLYMPDVPEVLLSSGLDRATLIGNAVNSRRLQPHVIFHRMEEAGDLP